MAEENGDKKKTEETAESLFETVVNYNLSLYRGGFKKITREHVIQHFGGGYLQRILEKRKTAGDLMHNMDLLIEESFDEASKQISVKSEVIGNNSNELCQYHVGETCTKSEDANGKIYDGRKICNNREFTVWCKKLYLKIIQ